MGRQQRQMNRYSLLENNYVNRHPPRTYSKIAMRKSRRNGSKRRAQAWLVYAVAVMSSFILSGMSPLAVAVALESTEKINREDVNTPRILQHDEQYLRLKGQSELSTHQRRDDRQLVANKEKTTKTVRTSQNKVKMKPTSTSVKQSKINAHTTVTKTAGQSIRTKVRNPLKEQMIRARLEKRAKMKRQKVNSSDEENHTTEAEAFLGNLELRLHQQMGGGRDKSDRYDRRSGKPSGGWNYNRWSKFRRPGGNWPGGKPRGWKPDWESDRWKPTGSKPRNRWSGGTRSRDQWSEGGRWSGKNNWAKPCRCTYTDPVEESGSSWSWTGSSWRWGGKKVCTCEPTYEPTYYPTYYPTTDPAYLPTRSPTLNPTLSPTLYPTRAPTLNPTLNPTAPEPTASPTLYPTLSPTVPQPTLSPTLTPTCNPTLAPTLSPTFYPTLSPSLHPTPSPTQTPTLSPTLEPTVSPTLTPTETPTMSPTFTPTESPTFSPTMTPTISPTFYPTDPPKTPVL